MTTTITMASQQVSITCAAELACLPRLIGAIDQFCDQTGLDDATRHDLRLIAEEACVNVIRHAYPGGMSGDVTLQAELAPHDGRQAIHVTIQDRGIPFDPLAIAPPDHTLPMDERPIGGLGIHLIRQLSDLQRYCRGPHQRNIFTVIKFLKTKLAES